MSVDNRRVLYQVIYLNGEFCWLNGTITRDNPLTAHHIVPIRMRGKTTVENIASLTDYMHKCFNLVEQHYPELGAEINGYFKKYKGVYPEEVEARINQIFALVDTTHIGLGEHHQKQKCKAKRHRR